MGGSIPSFGLKPVQETLPDKNLYYFDGKKTQLTVATLNYGGVMYSPYEFITQTYQKELNQLSLIFLGLLAKYLPNFDSKTFKWQLGEIEKKFKKDRYSPLYNLSVGVEAGRLISQKEFEEKWEKVYEEKCPPKIKGQAKKQQKQSVRLFDFVAFHTLLACVYGGKNKAFEDLIKEKPDEYLKFSKKYFELSFLSAQKKLHKFSEAFSSEKNETDIYIIEEFSPQFEKNFNNKKYFKATDAQNDVLILANTRLFKQIKHKEVVFAKLSEEDKKSLEFSNGERVALLFVDNFIIVGVHFSSKEEKNAQQIQSFKVFLKNLRRCFPGEQIICGGDMNTNLHFDEDISNKDYFMFPSDSETVTTSKKRSMLQAQFKKGNQIINESKDKIISTLKINSNKIVYINGEESNKFSLLPTDEHPFDHFVLLVSISLKIPENLPQRKAEKSKSKVVQTPGLKVATLNYGGIMNSPFEFYTHKYINELEKISRIFVKLLPTYFYADFKPEKFKWDTGKAEQKYKRGRYSPLYNPEVGVEKNKFVSKEQFKKEWEAAYEKCPEKVRAQTSENQKNQCFIYDLLAFHTLLANVYGGGKTFEELVQQNPEPYLQKYRQFFSLSFLDEKKKLNKFQIALERINADIFFIQEYSTAFEQTVDDKAYFKSIDNERDTMVLVSKKSFNKQISIEEILLKLSPQDKISLEYLKENGIASIFLDNFIIFAVHLSSKSELNPLQVQKLKAFIIKLTKILPQHHIICGGDINSFLDFDQKFTSKTIHAFPVLGSELTTIKKRTMIQAQYHKGNTVVKESKDKIFSSLPMIDAKIVYVDDSKVDELSYVPTDDHPFDHFLLVATIPFKKE